MTCVTFVASTEASAPGYAALMVSEGGVIVGYCSIGSDRSAMKPAKTIASAITHEKTGRSMKKRELMAARSAPGVGGLRRRGWRGAHRHRLHRLSRRGLLQAVDDHVLTRVEAALDYPRSALERADLHRPHFGDVLRIHHHHRRALRRHRDGALRNEQPLRLHAGLDAAAHELARQQGALRVRELGAQRCRAGGL